MLLNDEGNNQDNNNSNVNNHNHNNISCLLDIILSKDDIIRNLSLNDVIQKQQKQLERRQVEEEDEQAGEKTTSLKQWLLEQCRILESFRKFGIVTTSTSSSAAAITTATDTEDVEAAKTTINNNANQDSNIAMNHGHHINLYEHVRCCFFLYAIHRYYLSQDDITLTKPTTDSSSGTPTNEIEEEIKKRNKHQQLIPYRGYQLLQNRNYEEAIDTFLLSSSNDDDENNKSNNPISCSISSALGQTYYQLGFQLLSNQVRISVQEYPGNSWMYNVLYDVNTQCIINYPKEYTIKSEMTIQNQQGQYYPYIKESTPVRMDITHCGWSDIFFLGMDYPEGAKVINCSINLVVEPQVQTQPDTMIDTSTSNNCTNTNIILPKAPIDTYVQIIDEPGVLKLTSIDLKCEYNYTNISDIFDFGKDYLGLIKAGIIASGIIPIGLEKYNNIPLSLLLNTIMPNTPNKGLHITTHVHDIPKGSRLAVSTNLLASIIAACMRITNQITILNGPLINELDRRFIAARCILGEWLGGSGGGWQDSGGIWPGIKMISGVLATSNHQHDNNVTNRNDKDINDETTKIDSHQSDHHHHHRSTSRGMLLPIHRPLFDTNDEVTNTTITSTSDTSSTTSTDSTTTIKSKTVLLQELYDALQDQLILVHGGMSQNVGPILNMVTEKYLLREYNEWIARQECLCIYEQMIESLYNVNIHQLANLTTQNFVGPLQTIIPWATNQYTELIIKRTAEQLKEHYIGFWMLGGASGGGMGFLFTKESNKKYVKHILYNILYQTKKELQYSLPFAMDPVIYNFSINPYGTVATLYTDDPNSNPTIRIPTLSTVATNSNNDNSSDEVSSSSTNDIDKSKSSSSYEDMLLDDVLKELNFNYVEHENIRNDYQNGKIGLSQNRLPSATTTIHDVDHYHDVIDTTDPSTILSDIYQKGYNEIQKGTIAVISLAAGVGSRWTHGSGCVKALNPFCQMNNQHRNFIEVHLAKSRKVSQLTGTTIPHVITTSIMTDDAIRTHLQRENYHQYDEQLLYVSLGKTMGLRLIPTVSDLQYMFHHQNLNKLDEQQQKVRESCQKSMIEWVVSEGEGTDYRNNIPMQCLHPVGHYYEIPNLLLNGTLYQMLLDRPQLQYLMLHNIDTVGVNVDPGIFGLFIQQHEQYQTSLCFEVIRRHINDIGGGLARINNDNVRIVEGLALPNDEDEFHLSYYNTMTTWIHIDSLLNKFGLNRSILHDINMVNETVHTFSRQLPTYVTLKEVKKCWGNAQEDILLTAQFEKLWSDMSSLYSNDTKYFVVSRYRGNQLKDIAQLDGWLRDGSASYVESLCSWEK